VLYEQKKGAPFVIVMMLGDMEKQMVTNNAFGATAAADLSR